VACPSRVLDRDRGHLAAPPLPHHRTYGSVRRRFDQVKPLQETKPWSRYRGRVYPSRPPWRCSVRDLSGSDSHGDGARKRKEIPHISGSELTAAKRSSTAFSYRCYSPRTKAFLTLGDLGREADAADPVTTGLAGGPHETLPEERRLVIPWSIARLALTLGGNCFRARQRRHGDEDDAGPVLNEATRSRPSASFLNAGDSWVCRGQLVSFAIAG
jgi:hypothetical protein